MDLHKILYLVIFRKSLEKIQVSLKYDKYNGYFTWRFHMNDYPAEFFLEREMVQIKVLEKIKT